MVIYPPTLQGPEVFHALVMINLTELKASCDVILANSMVDEQPVYTRDLFGRD
ncbi:UDP-glucose 6-dehydrogenase [Aeromonas caviae]